MVFINRTLRIIGFKFAEFAVSGIRGSNVREFFLQSDFCGELKVLRSCPEVLAIADGAPENASIATSTAVNAIFFMKVHS